MSRGAAWLLQGNNNGAGVVCTEHPLAPPQKGMAHKLPGAGNTTWSLPWRDIVIGEKEATKFVLKKKLHAFWFETILIKMNLSAEHDTMVQCRYKSNAIWLSKYICINTIASSLSWHMEIASWGGTIFQRPSLPRII